MRANLIGGALARGPALAASSPSPTKGLVGAERSEAGEGPAPCPSPQLQGGEAGDRQDPGDDPEADHDLRLLPPHLLEMMVQRRHAEDAPAGHLVARDLDDDRYRFEHEKTADDGEHQLVLGHDADRPERGAD